MELRGSLTIHNLEKVTNREEVDNAQLSSKRKLDELKLCWNLEQSSNTAVDELLESLRPHSDLERLHIEGHRGTTCPTWLGTNISVKSLDSLCLHNVSWETLPAFGQLLKLNDLQLKHLVAIGEFGIEVSGHTTNQSFQNLKRLELVDMPKLEKWVGGKTCHLLSNLEVLIVTDCPELVELPYSQYSSSSTQDKNSNWFPRLQKLTIARCPNLSVLPLIPYTSTLCSVAINKVGSCLETLEYPAEVGHFVYSIERSLVIELKEHPTNDLHSLDKNVLAFHNLTNLVELHVTKYPSLALKHVQMLKSLKCLRIRECKRIILDIDEETNLNCQLPIELLEIYDCGVSVKELSQLLFCLPALSGLEIWFCQGLKRMGVVEEQQHQVIEEDEGLLLFPSHFSTSLLELKMVDCSDLRLVMVSAGAMAGEGRSRGLQGLHSLVRLTIKGCPDILSTNCDEDMTSHCCPFLASLQKLCLDGVQGIPSLALSNLTSLTSLDIWDTDGKCFEDLGWDEVEQHVLIHVNLNRWEVWGGTLTGRVLEKKASESGEREKGKGEEKEPPHLLPSSSSHHHPHPHVLHFTTTDLPGFLMAPSLCTRLSSSLQTLEFSFHDEVEGFTAEQELALQLLTSLQVLVFGWCKKLRSLPAGLHRFRNLKRLEIYSCPELRNRVAELLTQGNLIELKVKWSHNFFSADWEPSRGAVAVTALPNSSRLQELQTNDIAGFLMAPSLYSLLSSSLQTLFHEEFSSHSRLESFTADQEQALQLLTSLQVLEFESCWNLHSLPAGLHRLCNLKRLQIKWCPEIRSLPKEGLPTSLQQLVLSGLCSNELKRECSKLIDIPEIILFDN